MDTIAAPHPDPDGSSLPAWTYSDPGFFAQEREAIFMRSWQLVCHVNDLAEPGSYRTLDIMGEPIFVVRSEDRSIRGFFNVCRHRAARLVDGDGGRCGSRISCPYHAWTYALDGRLIGVPLRRSFEGLDLDRHGLVPIEVETFEGLVFARIESGGPSLAEMMAPYAGEIRPYRLAEMTCIWPASSRRASVNWKNVLDNYGDSLHITVAHPGLKRLFGKSYGIEAKGWVHKMWGDLQDGSTGSLSERTYLRHLPAVGHLPADRQRQWAYYKLWPSVGISLYPDQIDLMQMIPVSPTETIIRESAYAMPDDRRAMRVVRRLNWRINQAVSAEDDVLCERVQQGMASRSYTAGPLGAGEVCLRDFAAKMRTLLPACEATVGPAVERTGVARSG